MDTASLCEAAAVEGNLAPREIEVLGKLLDGMTEAKVAERLSISRHTVHAHTRSLYAKLRVHNRVELLRRVLSFVDSHGAGLRPAFRRDGA